MEKIKQIFDQLDEVAEKYTLLTTILGTGTISLTIQIVQKKYAKYQKLKNKKNLKEILQEVQEEEQGEEEQKEKNGKEEEEEKTNKNDINNNINVKDSAEAQILEKKDKIQQDYENIRSQIKKLDKSYLQIIIESVSAGLSVGTLKHYWYTLCIPKLVPVQRSEPINDKQVFSKIFVEELQLFAISFIIYNYLKYTERKLNKKYAEKSTILTEQEQNEEIQKVKESAYEVKKTLSWKKYLKPQIWVKSAGQYLVFKYVPIHFQALSSQQISQFTKMLD